MLGSWGVDHLRRPSRGARLLASRGPMDSGFRWGDADRAGVAAHRSFSGSLSQCLDGVKDVAGHLARIGGDEKVGVVKGADAHNPDARLHEA